MINHLRTLLVNADGGVFRHPEAPGEEYTPPNYRTVTLPQPLQRVRRFLFGSDPDRWMLNYRLREFMNILHRPETDKFTRTFDARTTYTAASQRLGDFQFGISTEMVGGEIADLAIYSGLGDDDVFFVFGEQERDTRQGRLRSAWRVALHAPIVLETRVGPLHRDEQANQLVQGLSPNMALPLSGLFIRYNEATIGTVWRVDSIVPPSQSLGQIAAELRLRLTDEELTELFKGGGDMQTFRNMWVNAAELPRQLAGLLLALAWRTEAYRTREGR